MKNPAPPPTLSAKELAASLEDLIHSEVEKSKEGVRVSVGGTIKITTKRDNDFVGIESSVHVSVPVPPGKLSLATARASRLVVAALREDLDRKTNFVGNLYGKE